MVSVWSEHQIREIGTVFTDGEEEEEQASTAACLFFIVIPPQWEKALGARVKEGLIAVTRHFCRVYSRLRSKGAGPLLRFQILPYSPPLSAPLSSQPKPPFVSLFLGTCSPPTCVVFPLSSSIPLRFHPFPPLPRLNRLHALQISNANSQPRRHTSKKNWKKKNTIGKAAYWGKNKLPLTAQSIYPSLSLSLQPALQNFPEKTNIMWHWSREERSVPPRNGVCLVHSHAFGGGSL